MCEFITKQRWGNQYQQVNVNAPLFVYVKEHLWIATAVFLVLAFVTWLILSRTVLGRHVYALGGNEQAARLSGIRTDSVKWFAYCFGALTASIAGIFAMADGSVVQPVNLARGFELNAIAAAVVGGCSLRGGEGTILGVIIGTAVMRVLYNAINILGIPTHLEFAIIGSVILAGVIADELVKRFAAQRRATRAAGDATEQ
jgi:ribose/xylose/arabinose/galactoside ABC-type transport system permease subunit